MKHLPLTPNSFSPLTRRSFLQAASAAGLSFSTLRAATFEDDPTGGKRKPTLVVVFLRGGVDGLNLIVPYGEDAYYRLRPQLGIRRPGSADGTAIDLDGFFGLHPAAASLAPMFQSGLAACVHAVGTPANTRSHFEEQDRWETAVDGAELETSGWLNRYLSGSRGRGPVRALALGERLPRSMRGDVATLALRGLDDLVPRGSQGDLERTLTALGRAYGGGKGGGSSELLRREGRASLEALEQLKDVARNPPASKVEYPNTDLGRRARELARLVRADVGLEIVELDVGGWDTHENQGAAQGTYANNVRQVSDALAALVRDLEDDLDDLMIVTVSEFGRTAAQNGTFGTDHGWGSCVLALGGPVLRTRAKRKGPVLGDWPGLEREQLNQERDLAHTTDFRDVYAEMLTFLGCKDVGEVLPGHGVTRLGLV
ncbi:MAG: DUF1501 domain-containing protein [Planctomycetota bacterium]